MKNHPKKSRWKKWSNFQSMSSIIFLHILMSKRKNFGNKWKKISNKKSDWNKKEINNYCKNLKLKDCNICKWLSIYLREEKALLKINLQKHRELAIQIILIDLSTSHINLGKISYKKIWICKKRHHYLASNLKKCSKPWNANSNIQE